MANTRTENVIIVDTDAVFAENLIIEAIKYIAGSGTPSAVIKADSASGVTIWETADTAERYEEICIRARQGIHVNVEGTGTKVYLYLK